MTTPKQQLLEGLAGIAGIEARPSKVAGGTALFHGGQEIAHFHHDQELDLRLTRPLIRAQGLQHPPGSALHPRRGPSSPWIELPLRTEADAQRVLGLVRLLVADT